jgi:hypothetical protein
MKDRGHTTRPNWIANPRVCMKSIATLFHCPVCAAKYEVVGFEALPGPATEGDVACLCCGGPLHASEGKFLLKYFLIERPRLRA